MWRCVILSEMLRAKKYKTGHKLNLILILWIWINCQRIIYNCAKYFTFLPSEFPTKWHNTTIILDSLPMRKKENFSIEKRIYIRFLAKIPNFFVKPTCFFESDSRMVMHTLLLKEALLLLLHCRCAIRRQVGWPSYSFKKNENF